LAQAVQGHALPDPVRIAHSGAQGCVLRRTHRINESL
jgi:hypothetical protein